MNSKRHIAIIILSVLIAFFCSFQEKPAQEQEYNLKAAFLYRFLDYIEWDERTSDSGAITITILGPSGIYSPLLDLSRSKKNGGKSIIVRQQNNIDNIPPTQVLFIARNSKIPIGAALNRLEKRPVLIVSERNGDLDKGSHINFLITENKLRFEVNLKKASLAGFKISSQLLQHATVIKR